jgi:hypothetical protein
MDNIFTYEKKKKLADKISKIKKKEELVKIFEIIYEDNKNITETQNGLFMIFNTLNDATYHKLDLYLRSTIKKKTNNNIITTTSENVSENEYKSYTQNEFPDQEHFNPKLKYSNREKNIIKRQRYDKLIENEKNDNNSVVYQKFDTSPTPDSEKLEKSPDVTQTEPIKTTKTTKGRKPAVKRNKKTI